MHFLLPEKFQVLDIAQEDHHRMGQHGLDRVVQVDKIGLLDMGLGRDGWVEIVPELDRGDLDMAEVDLGKVEAVLDKLETGEGGEGMQEYWMVGKQGVAHQMQEERLGLAEVGMEHHGLLEEDIWELTVGRLQ